MVQTDVVLLGSWRTWSSYSKNFGADVPFEYQNGEQPNRSLKMNGSCTAH